MTDSIEMFDVIVFTLSILIQNNFYALNSIYNHIWCCYCYFLKEGSHLLLHPPLVHYTSSKLFLPFSLSQARKISNKGFQPPPALALDVPISTP